jgi:hypothetical protein
VSENGFRSYYGRPVIKEPVWTWEIPTYFFTGGLAGASSVLSLAAKIGRKEKLSRVSLYVGALADIASPLLLVSDLGRPERFHHMLRVVKVTSPMNLGAWILLVSGGASNTAALLELLDRLKPVKLAAESVAALAGPPLATYTGVLVSDTAVPVWHEARHELPGIFMQAMELRLGEVGEVYRKGAAGTLSWAAKALAGMGATILATRGGKSRRAAAVGGALVCAGELCLRWAVFKAGFQSARDPKYTVKPQRERLRSSA